MKVLTNVVRVILGIIALLVAREVVMVTGYSVLKGLRKIPSPRTAPQSSKSHWQSIKDTFPDHARDLDAEVIAAERRKRAEAVAERRRALLEDEDEYLRTHPQ